MLSFVLNGLAAASLASTLSKPFPASTLMEGLWNRIAWCLTALTLYHSFNYISFIQTPTALGSYCLRSSNVNPSRRSRWKKSGNSSSRNACR